MDFEREKTIFSGLTCRLCLKPIGESTATCRGDCIYHNCCAATLGECPGCKQETLKKTGTSMEFVLECLNTKCTWKDSEPVYMSCLLCKKRYTEGILMNRRFVCFNCYGCSECRRVYHMGDPKYFSYGGSCNKHNPRNIECY